MNSDMSLLKKTKKDQKVRNSESDVSVVCTDNNALVSSSGGPAFKNVHNAQSSSSGNIFDACAVNGIDTPWFSKDIGHNISNSKRRHTFIPLANNSPSSKSASLTSIQEAFKSANNEPDQIEEDTNNNAAAIPSPTVSPKSSEIYKFRMACPLSMADNNAKSLRNVFTETFRRSTIHGSHMPVGSPEASGNNCYSDVSLAEKIGQREPKRNKGYGVSIPLPGGPKPNDILCFMMGHLAEQLTDNYAPPAIPQPPRKFESDDRQFLKRMQAQGQAQWQAQGQAHVYKTRFKPTAGVVLVSCASGNKKKLIERDLFDSIAVSPSGTWKMQTRKSLSVKRHKTGDKLSVSLT